MNPDKTAAINKVVEIQQRAAQALIPYAIDSWRRLELPLGQLKSLFIVASREGTNLRSLSSDLGVTPGNVTGIIDRLAEQGLIMRRRYPGDRRVIRLEVTEKGRELLSNLIEVHNRHMVPILERMSPEELQALSRGIEAFTRAVEEHLRETGGEISGYKVRDSRPKESRGQVNGRKSEERILDTEGTQASSIYRNNRSKLKPGLKLES